MLREIVDIDEERCNGCGDCVPACHEGALQVIDESILKEGRVNYDYLK